MLIHLLLACTGSIDTPDTPGQETDLPEDSPVDSPELGWAQVLSEGARGVDVAVAPDGTVFALVHTNDGLLLSESSDGGASFSDPVTAVTGSFSGSGLSRPQLLTDGQRMAIAAAAGQSMWVLTAELGSTSFTEHRISTDAYKYEGLFVRAHFAPDGELWASVHAFPTGSGWTQGWKGVARESNDYALEPASTVAPGEPCECCPHDLGFLPDGRAMLAYRNNIDNVRDVWMAVGEDGAFSEATELADNDWALSYCPVQGPRVASGGDTVLVAWSDSADGASQVRVVRSATDTLEFGTPVDLGEDIAPYNPTIALDDEGYAWIAFEQGEGSALVTSEDGGETWSAPEAISAPGGPIEAAELAVATAGPAVISGVDASGAAWVGQLR